MAFNAAHWTITRSNGNIRYIGDAHAGSAPSYATGIELHRALQDFADQEVDSGDDELSIIDNVPSQRGGVDTNITLLNGFNIDQVASEHLYDTSLTQAGGAEIYDGIQVFGNSVSIQVIQNGARLTNAWWNEAKMITAVEDAASSTTHRFLLLVRTGSADIDGRRLIGTQRVLGTVYTEFAIGGGTNRGNNVLALTANNDLNNANNAITIGGWDTIVNSSEGYNTIDADTLGLEPFYSNWTVGSQSKNDFYERAKWIQAEESAARDADQIIYGLDGDIFRGITHEITIDTPTGTFVEPEAISWPGGTGQLLAIDSVTAGTKMYIQLLTGIAPVNDELITGSGTALMNVTIVPQLLSLPFVGASTGSAIIGAYGLGLLETDLGQFDLVTDLNGGSHSPPNNVTFTVNGLVSSEDYVLVGPEAAGLLDVAQLGQNAAISGAAVGTLVMDSAIPVDTPQGGQIRCLVSDGRYVKIPFDSYTGSTFTLTGTHNFSGVGDDVEINANVFIAYIDELNAAGTTLSYTTVYNNGLGDRTLVVRRRYGAAGGGGPTVPAESTAVLGSGGGQTTPARVSDL